MNFKGIELVHINSVDGKYGIAIYIPSHLEVVSVGHKKASDDICDPLGVRAIVGGILKEA